METKEKKSYLYEWIIVIICLVNVGFVVILSYALIQMGDNCEFPEFYKPLDVSLSNSEITDIEDCGNMSAFDVSYCLTNHFSGIFSYNETPDYDYENFSNIDRYIKTYGGDCHESASWFTKAATDLGHHAEYVNIVTDYYNESNSSKPDIKYMHAFAVIADMDHYCILDQGRIICKTLSGGSKYATG